MMDTAITGQQPNVSVQLAAFAMWGQFLMVWTLEVSSGIYRLLNTVNLPKQTLCAVFA